MEEQDKVIELTDQLQMARQREVVKQERINQLESEKIFMTKFDPRGALSASVSLSLSTSQPLDLSASRPLNLTIPQPLYLSASLSVSLSIS